jgi:hypothetical protein
MPDNPDGFEENPQAPLSSNDEQENVIDESMFGPQKKLTPEEQSEYDDWLRRKVGRSLQRIKDGTAVFHSHEEVMARARARLEQRIAEAQKRAD